jgi:hypothetical protein
VTMRVGGWAMWVCAAIALSACGEKAQTAGGKRKADVPPWQGAPDSSSVAAGWKAGDEASWEQQIRNRAQGQNEYARGAPQ